MDDSSDFSLGAGSKEFLEDIDSFPFFLFHVKDIYGKFVENCAKICKEKCADEFYSTRTIYWEFTSE